MSEQLEELLQRVRALEADSGIGTRPKPWKPKFTCEELRERFEEQGNCWHWPGEAIESHNRDPALTVWEAFGHGEVKYGYILRRGCKTQRCVKPEHMLPPMDRRDLEGVHLERMVWEGAHIRAQHEKERAQLRAMRGKRPTIEDLGGVGFSTRGVGWSKIGDETMSYLDEFLAMKKPPKKKRAELPKPSADVVVYPQGPSLGVAKAERTRAPEIDRAFRRAERPRDPMLTLGVAENGYWKMGPGGPQFVPDRQPRRLDGEGNPIRRETSNDYDLFKGI
jgi:hypothetical protein